MVALQNKVSNFSKENEQLDATLFDTLQQMRKRDDHPHNMISIQKLVKKI